ncbi:hypothetical protein MRX96_014391 [Rhipicephalus microplus]
MARSAVLVASSSWERHCRTARRLPSTLGLGGPTGGWPRTKSEETLRPPRRTRWVSGLPQTRGGSQGRSQLSAQPPASDGAATRALASRAAPMGYSSTPDTRTHLVSGAAAGSAFARAARARRIAPRRPRGDICVRRGDDHCASALFWEAADREASCSSGAPSGDCAHPGLASTTV